MPLSQEEVRKETAKILSVGKEVPLGAPAEEGKGRAAVEQTYVSPDAETPPGAPTGMTREQYDDEQKEAEEGMRTARENMEERLRSGTPVVIIAKPADHTQEEPAVVQTEGTI